MFACLCRCEVAVLRRRCRQLADKARLRWVLWPWALTDYYYYCYYPRGGSLSVRVAQGPWARWPAAEAGRGADGVQGGAGWGGGWGLGRGGSWWWGHWAGRGAPDLLRHSVSSVNEKNNSSVWNVVIYCVCSNLAGRMGSVSQTHVLTSTFSTVNVETCIVIHGKLHRSNICTCQNTPGQYWSELLWCLHTHRISEFLSILQDYFILLKIKLERTFQGHSRHHFPKIRAKFEN